MLILKWPMFRIHVEESAVSESIYLVYHHVAIVLPGLCDHGMVWHSMNVRIELFNKTQKRTKCEDEEHQHRKIISFVYRHFIVTIIY